MKPQRLIALAISLAVAALAAAPVSAQMYKWVDAQGMTHYSDRKPDDLKDAEKAKPVAGAVSVYSPDKSLLRAVEIARDRASQPEPPVEPDRSARPYVATANPQPVQSDPCANVDCGGYYYPYAPAFSQRRHGQRLDQAVLPAGATAGTVNSPGIIPGNTGTQFGVPTRPSATPPRGTPYPSRPSPDPRSFR